MTKKSSKKNKKAEAPTLTRKDELLAKYATKPVTVFKKYDCFFSSEEYGDKDGDDLWAAITAELMNGADVRVLIKPETKRADAIRALTKIVRLIDKNSESVIENRDECNDVLKMTGSDAHQDNWGWDDIPPPPDFPDDWSDGDSDILS
jgi:hypothetical protein